MPTSKFSIPSKYYAPVHAYTCKYICTHTSRSRRMRVDARKSPAWLAQNVLKAINRPSAFSHYSRKVAHVTALALAEQKCTSLEPNQSV